MPNDALTRWIEAIDRLDTPALPTRAEMEAVARDLGLGDDVLEQAAEAATAHRVRVERFLEEQLPAEAVLELERARELEPWSLLGLEQLGQAQLALHRQTGAQAAREAALHWARVLIDRAPERKVAFALLRDAQKVHAARRTGLIVAVLGTLASIVFLAAVVAIPASDEASQKPSLPPRVAPPDRAPVVVRTLADTVPVGMTLTASPPKVILPAGDDRWMVATTVLLQNQEAGILSRAKTRIQVLGADGSVLASGITELVTSRSASVGKGERALHDVFVRGQTEAHPAAIEVSLVEVTELPGDRPIGVDVPLTWASPQPAGVELTLRRREGGDCRPSGERFFCEGVFVVENSGAVPVSGLKVGVTFGESGVETQTWAFNSDEMPLLPGQREPFRVIKLLDGQAPLQPWNFAVVRADTP